MLIVFIIVFDIFLFEKCGKMGGLFGVVFGLFSIFGLLFGVYIIDYISWYWVFYINLLFGILVFIFIIFFYKELCVYRK